MIEIKKINNDCVILKGENISFKILNKKNNFLWIVEGNNLFYKSNILIIDCYEDYDLYTIFNNFYNNMLCKYVINKEYIQLKYIFNNNNDFKIVCDNYIDYSSYTNHFELINEKENWFNSDSIKIYKSNDFFMLSFNKRKNENEAIIIELSNEKFFEMNNNIFLLNNNHQICFNEYISLHRKRRIR